ncbi:hypothetical protein ACEQUB_02876 [Ralstonia syzygii]
MGTITKRGELQWQAKVRRKGFPQQSRTFMYKEDAEKWVRSLERELETSGFVDRREAEKNTLREVLKRYREEVTPDKKSAEIESIKIDVILKDAVLPSLKMSAITSTAVAAWRDRRLKEVSGATVNREIDVLSAVLNHARKEWGIHLENPIPHIRRPEKARARERRLSELEEQYLFNALDEGSGAPTVLSGRGRATYGWHRWLSWRSKRLCDEGSCWRCAGSTSIWCGALRTYPTRRTGMRGRCPFPQGLLRSWGRLLGRTPILTTILHRTRPAPCFLSPRWLCERALREAWSERRPSM